MRVEKKGGRGEESFNGIFPVIFCSRHERTDILKVKRKEEEEKEKNQRSGKQRR